MNCITNLLLVGGICFLSNCSPNHEEEEPRQEEAQTAHVNWESGFKIVSDLNDDNYHGYARMIQLKDGRLLLTYFDSGETINGGIIARYSTDQGKTWSDPEVIHHNTQHHEFNNPEIIELKDGTLMVLTNLRPTNPGGSYNYEIGLITKPAGGTWSTVSILYRADNQFHNGCWEPKLVELPDGNLEIYFANENNFRNNDDQEISKLYSLDKGLSWTGPVRFCYSAGARDGMPVSIVINEIQPKVLTAIEDNSKGGRFTISILESPAVAGSVASVRLHGVVPDEMADKSIYCGAPYLAALPNGGLLLTGQTDYQRIKQNDPLHISVPFIAISEPNSYSKFRLLDANPFRISSQHEGLWNSVTVVGEKVYLLTSSQTEGGRFKVLLKTGLFKDAD